MLTLPADPYLALGVSRESQLAEIRTAYRKLILKCHPDKIPDPLLKKQKQDEFQRVQQAYELLSSEAERSRYDEMYKLNELQKEMSKMSTSSPNPARSSRRERDPEYYNGARVYTAEPRSSTYASPSPKSYAAGTPGCRSYEEFSIPVYDHHAPRKTASYERSAKSDWEKRSPREEREERERKSKKDDKRDREEKTRKEEKEKRDKKDAERREKEKKKEKEDKKDREEKERKEKKKKTDQVRKKDAELKTQQQKTYVKPTYAPVAYSSSDSDSDEIVRPTKKTSGAREKGQPVVSSERERKYSETMEIATDYLSRSGHSGKTPVNVRTSKPQATDQFMRHINIPAVPTPPPVGTGPHAPPPPPAPPQYDDDEDLAHRSSAAKSSARRVDRSTSHKKSTTRGTSRDPAGVDYASRGVPPPLQKSNTMPPSAEYPRAHPSRAHTEYTVRPGIPTMTRAQTYIDPRTSDYARELSPSRQRRTHYSDDEDSDSGRRHRSSRKHRSPEAADRTYRYAVDPGKTSTRQVSHEDIPRHKSSKPGYHAANSSARMDPVGSYESYSAARPAMKVNYAQTFGEDEIKYAHLQHAPNYRSEDIYTY